MSNSEQRDSWLNSGHWTLDADSYDLAKWLSYYLYFLFFFYFWMYIREVTYREAQDKTVGLGLEICISSIQNLMGTLLSSLCKLRF